MGCGAVAHKAQLETRLLDLHDYAAGQNADHVDVGVARLGRRLLVALEVAGRE